MPARMPAALERVRTRRRMNDEFMVVRVGEGWCGRANEWGTPTLRINVCQPAGPAQLRFYWILFTIFWISARKRWETSRARCFRVCRVAGRKIGSNPSHDLSGEWFPLSPLNSQTQPPDPAFPGRPWRQFTPAGRERHAPLRAPTGFLSKSPRLSCVNKKKNASVAHFSGHSPEIWQIPLVLVAGRALKQLATETENKKTNHENQIIWCEKHAQGLARFGRYV